MSLFLVIIHLCLIQLCQCGGETFTILTKERIELLKNYGFVPDVVLDVGANTGDWSLLVSTIFDRSTFLLIEGNMHFNNTLAQTGFPYEIALVGDEEKEVTFFTSKNDYHHTGSSIFREDNLFYNEEHVQKEVVEMRTIDSIVNQKGFLGRVNFMKIDVQGAEILALKGASETLKTVDFVMIEVPILQYNKGSPSLFELHTMFEVLGYVIIDVLDLKYIGNRNEKKPGQVKVNKDGFYGDRLMQMDILLIKRTSKFYLRDSTLFNPYQRNTDTLASVCNLESRQQQSISADGRSGIVDVGRGSGASGGQRGSKAGGRVGKASGRRGGRRGGRGGYSGARILSETTDKK